MKCQEMSYREALRLALSEEMRRDENVVLIGEDIGLYGGSFKVTFGMIEEFGERRIMDTPISESCIIGCSVGAAMTGLRPVCEMMFSDFIAYGMDSLANQAAKMRYMFGGKAKVPMVVRLPGGCGTGAAAQHSQSLEAWACHVPGLKVVTASTPAQAKGLLKAAIRDNNPVCFYEHKLLYNMKGPVPENEDYIIELGKSYVEREGKDITIVSWGRMLVECIKAAERLAEEGIEAEVINPMTLYPMDMEPIDASVKKTGRLLVVHEAAKTGGLGGEIVSRVVESDCFNYLKAAPIRLGGLDVPIPHNKYLEQAVVPQLEDIEDAVSVLMAH